MKARLLSLVFVMCLIPVLLIAQDGKLRGRVTDKQTGEPLIGANILVEGTTRGAATDVNGDYIVLSLPPGLHTIRATYIGYATFTISNIRIHPDGTTTQDFQLTSSAVQVQGVEIVAERPLIQRNTTNTVRVSNVESIEHLPFRGVENVLALQAGVVQENGNLYVRGGRAGETAYYVDGANVTNPFSNRQNVNVIQEAIEELAIQSGGYTAEFGGASSAIVRTSVRTGGSDLKLSVDYQTDDFAKPGQTFLGTSSFGFRNVVASVSGPIPYIEGANFYVAGQHNYMRDYQVMYLKGFTFQGLTNDGVAGGRPAGQLLPNNGTIEFKNNYLYNNWTENNTIQGTVSHSVGTLRFRLTGSYGEQSLPSGNNWPNAPLNYFRLNRYMLNETKTSFANLRVTHIPSPSTFYEIGLSYTNRSTRVYDRDFGDNWQLYSDSIANAQKGYTGFLRRFSGPLQWSTIYGFLLNDPNAPNNIYNKNEQTSISANIDFTTQLGSNLELKAGGRIESWTMRLYSIGNIQAADELLYGLNGITPRPFSSELERRVTLARTASINNYGYDVDGNVVNSGFDEPRKPLFASTYVQTKFEYRDILLNLGVRYELYDTREPIPPDPSLAGSSGFNYALDVLDESSLVQKPATSFILPRISFSFPATDRTVFYAQYGKYAQLPALSQLFAGNLVLSRNISPSTRFPWGSANGFPPAFAVSPERTTQYEIGLRQIVSDNFAVTATGFYKNVSDQLQYNKYPSTEQPLFVSWSNQDFSSSLGLELTLELRRTRRLAAKMDYTFSDARGTASDAYEWYGPVSDITINSKFPVFINPLSFNQTHRGAITLDYRFAKGDGGPILEGTGVSLITSFNSGHNYTKILENWAQSSSPWTVGVQTNSRRKPTEPINASSTPWVFNLDLNFSKAMYFSNNLTAEFYVSVLNLLDSKEVLNVYETTGTPEDDGWLPNALSKSFRDIPNYSDFYRALNLDNRWTYMQRKGGNDVYGAALGGNDIYGSPRQIRVGLRMEINP